MNEPESSAGNGGWRILVLLAVLFFLPVALAAGLHLSGWRPAPSAAHGSLVLPPQPVADVVLGEVGGKPVSLGSFRSRWTLLYFGPAECPADCRRSLHAMRQVHIAQGKELERVQRVFVACGPTPPGGQDRLARDFPGMAVVAASGAGDGGSWPERWPREGRIFLVDPMGNLVMFYEPNADPGGMRKDLARLLSYSWVG